MTAGKRVLDLHPEMQRTDLEYCTAYAALQDEFDLVAAMVEVRKRAATGITLRQTFEAKQ